MVLPSPPRLSWMHKRQQQRASLILTQEQNQFDGLLPNRRTCLERQQSFSLRRSSPLTTTAALPNHNGSNNNNNNNNNHHAATALAATFQPSDSIFLQYGGCTDTISLSDDDENDDNDNENDIQLKEWSDQGYIKSEAFQILIKKEEEKEQEESEKKSQKGGSILKIKTLDESLANPYRGAVAVATEASSSSASTIKPTATTKIQFTNVTEYYFMTILGFHPTVSSGAPLALGGPDASFPPETYAVETYEMTVKRHPVRAPNQLKLSAGQRQRMLRQAGVRQVDIQRRTEQCDEWRSALLESANRAKQQQQQQQQQTSRSKSANKKSNSKSRNNKKGFAMPKVFGFLRASRRGFTAAAAS